LKARTVLAWVTLVGRLLLIRWTRFRCSTRSTRETPRWYESAVFSFHHRVFIFILARATRVVFARYTLAVTVGLRITRCWLGVAKTLRWWTRLARTVVFASDRFASGRVGEITIWVLLARRTIDRTRNTWETIVAIVRALSFVFPAVFFTRDACIFRTDTQILWYPKGTGWACASRDGQW